MTKVNNGTWSLTNPPPKGHEDVAEFAWALYEISRNEKFRLGLMDRWATYYQRFRTGQNGSGPTNNRVTINLFFANVQRTVANITARTPMAEVVDLEGVGDGADKKLTARVKKWWGETNQHQKLRTTATQMELYGATIEKAYWDTSTHQPNATIVDPYAFFPAPGNWEDLGADCPYIAHGSPEEVEGIESQFNVKGVEPDDVYTVLGEDRDELVQTIRTGVIPGSNNAVGNHSNGGNYSNKQPVTKENRALVIELWLRDYTKEQVEVETECTCEEEECVCEKQKIERFKYPGGIRVITVTNQGNLLLDDKPNPNINSEWTPAEAEISFLYHNFPFYMSTSYEDTTSLWGFSACEQTLTLSTKINQLVNQAVTAVQKSMSGILVIPPGSGIKAHQITNQPNTVFFPATLESAAGIRVVAMPNTNYRVFEMIDSLIALHDRVYQIEDADRGNAPSGVIAASAIVALQERNAVLIQHKIQAVDHLIRTRGRCAIALWQSFGHRMEQVEVEGDAQEFIGNSLTGRKFNYVVEAGSTMPRTSMQLEEQAGSLYDKGVIDRQALLEAVNFPGAKEILERVGEGQLGQAIQILIQAGMPEDVANSMYTQLMQPQGGPGNRPQTPPKSQPQAGTPRAEQGARA